MRKERAADTLLLAALALLLAGMLARVKGNGDVDIFLDWMAMLRTDGLVRGFSRAVQNADALCFTYCEYPPGAYVVLHLANGVARLLHVTPFVALKAIITAWCVGSGALFFLWTRRPLLSLGFFFSLIPSSVALGYIDIFYLPLLVGSVWATERRCLFLASFLLATSFLIKWQPLVVAPFFAVLAIKWAWESTRDISGRARAIGGVVLAGLLPVVVTLAVFDPGLILTSFQAATSHAVLSYQGLNVLWILQMVLYAPSGAAPWTVPPGMGMLWCVRVLFVVTYGAVLWRYLKTDSSFDQYVRFACLGFMSYFMLNPGVHENHLFVPMVLAFCAWATNPDDLFVVTFLAVMANANLLVFDGIEGTWHSVQMEGPVGNALTVGLAAVNSLFFVVLALRTFRGANGAALPVPMPAGERNVEARHRLRARS